MINIIELDDIVTNTRFFDGTNVLKKRIILSDTFSSSIDDYINYIKLFPTYRIPNYIVGKDGNIYQILKDNNYSLFIDDYNFHGKDKKSQQEFNSQSIIVCLENNGYLSNSNDLYLNHLNQEVNRSSVIEKNFRGYIYWDKYNEIQIENLFLLLDFLSEKTGILIKNPKNNSSLYEGFLNYSGLLFTSNINDSYLSPNPSFPFSSLKEKFSPLKKKSL
jgi:hypothetical protein